MSSEQTLAFAVAHRPPELFSSYWQNWREAVDVVSRRWIGSIDGEINQVIIPSLGAVRVIAQVVRSSRKPTGIVITTHGYEDVPDIFEAAYQPWAERGLIAIRLRVRGFPPSTLDMPDLRGQWILQGIESPDAWVLRGAVADVVQACRCARTHFGEELPICLHGGSFGGGLAVIAGAQLHHMGVFVSRIALALPSFGAMRWRSGRYCQGAGGQINMIVDAMRGEARDLLIQNLELFDAAFHAPSVTPPCLCKLAVLDDTVPGPSAAAVFNALNSPGKRRFVTQYGHFDGGISDVRRHAQFERLQSAFLDPSTDIAAALGKTDDLSSLKPGSWQDLQNGTLGAEPHG